MSAEWCRLRRSRVVNESSRDTGATNVYLVKCSDVSDGPIVALAASGLPSKGDAYSEDIDWLRVVSREASEVGESGNYFEVTVEYGEIGPEGGGSPTDKPGVLSLSFDNFEETIFEAEDIPDAFDADGNAVLIDTTWAYKKAIVSSSGSPFDPAISEGYADPVVQIEKNVDTSDFPTIYKLLVSYTGGRGSVNADNFYIQYRGHRLYVPKGTAWLHQGTSKSGSQGGVEFETISLSLRLREDGWRRRILDAGYRQAGDVPEDPNWFKTKPILDGNGEPVTTPVLLNGKGFPLTAGQKPVFLRFPTKKSRNFSKLMRLIGM